MSLIRKERPYEKAEFAPKPTWIVRFLRQNVLFQFYRFIMINIKMIKLIFKSHK
ncbi:MAG: hypothetical protein HON90_08905 [Halobacteriovoraceae bacterium]|jgi:hypothetical protein|nr:hypothetical protein [Halobacteriovoraceae bacterium]